MSYRRARNRHDVWCSWVAANGVLLLSVPRAALVHEDAFRAYLTWGTYRGVELEPQVSSLALDELEAIRTFIEHKTEFDMDTILFDAFNRALKAKYDEAFPDGVR